MGECSRSGYQRRRKYQFEIENCKKTHPMVDHFQEIHNGQKQNVLMKIVRQANIASNESVSIDSLAAEAPKSCLNLKSKWGLPKNPSLEARSMPQK